MAKVANVGFCRELPFRPFWRNGNQVPSPVKWPFPKGEEPLGAARADRKHWQRGD